MFRMINSFLHPEEGYSQAERAAGRGYREAQGYEQPFYNQGQAQYGDLNAARMALMHPEQLESQWAQGYETSPYAKQLLEQNKNSGLDAASSMGLMGSSAALGNIQTGAGNIVNQDRQQYMNDLMEKYMQGIGLGQNLYGVGAGAGGNMANRAYGHGENMANLRYGEENAPGEQLGRIAGTALNYFNPRPYFNFGRS